MARSKEKLISRNEARDCIARLCGIRAPDASTVSRWIGEGVSGVRLRATRVGGRVFTTEQAISEFLHELNTDDGDGR